MTPLCVRAVLASGALAVASAGQQSVTWHESFATAQQLSAESDKMMLLYFWMDDSEWCRALWANTLNAEGAASTLAQFECVSVAVTSPEFAELSTRFAIHTLPSIAFLDPQGRAEDLLEGALSLDLFQQHVARVRRQELTVTGRRLQAEANPEDLDLRMQYAIQLEHVGRKAEANSVKTSIKSDDPDGRSESAARLHLYDVMAQVRQASTDASNPSVWDPQPVYDHLPRIAPQPVLREAWVWLLDVQTQRGEVDALPRALVQLWNLSEERFDYGLGLLTLCFETERELSASEQKLVPEILMEGKMMAIRHRNPQVLGIAAHARALAAALEGDFEEAEREAEDAADLNPSESRHRDLLKQIRARAAKKSGR